VVVHQAHDLGSLANGCGAALCRTGAGITGSEDARATGLEQAIRPASAPARVNPCPATQGGLVLTRTPRDPGQLRVALDAAYAYPRSFAA
jgi:hypothetical protein